MTLRIKPTIILTALLLLTAAVYLRGIFGGFLFDDFHNLVDNDVLRQVGSEQGSFWKAAFSSGAGILKRPVSMFSFAVDTWLFGMDAALFKLNNIAIHLLSGWLVYRLALRLIPLLMPLGGRPASAQTVQLASLLAAGLWLLHPLHVSSVLYVVQRMNLLASVFLLAALLCYCRARTRQLAGNPIGWADWIGLAAFSLLSVFSKENGALLPFFALTIELFAFRFAAANPTTTKLWRMAYGLGLSLGCGAIATYLQLNPDYLSNAYTVRDFTLGERLMTQARMLWHYLLWTLLPHLHWLSLYHDDIATSRNLLSPATTLLAIAGLVALVALAYRLRNSLPALSFAISWFLLGHLMESSVLPLEMVFEHRQYIPMVGLSIGLMGWLCGATALGPRTTATLLVAIAALGLSTSHRAWVWNDPKRLILTTADQHPDSPRSQYDAARFLIEHIPDSAARQKAVPEAQKYLQRAAALSPTFVHPLAAMLIIHPKETPAPQALLLELEKRLRTAPLLSPLPLVQVLRACNKGQLDIPPDGMARLIEASLSNLSLAHSGHALVLTNYGYYLAKVAKDPVEGMNAMQAAIAIQPGFALNHLNAAYLAEQQSDFVDAAKHLENASKTDVLGIYADELAAFEKRLAALSNPTTAP